MNSKLACLVALLGVSSFAFGDTYTYSGSQVFKITYEGAAVTDFPLLLKLDTTKVPNLYEKVVNAGADLQFTSLDGGTEYPYEVDTWNPDGTSLVWVKVPNFAKDVMFKMKYGCADKTTNSNSTQVWTGYDLVCHVNGNANDSSPNNRSGLLNPTGVNVEGKIGAAYGMPTSVTGKGAAIINQLYGKGNTEPLSDPEFSYSFWVRRNDEFLKWQPLVGPRNTANASAWGIGSTGATDAKSFYMWATQTSKNSINVPDGLPIGSWRKVDVLQTGTGVTLFVDGVEVGSLSLDAPNRCWVEWMGWGGACGSGTFGDINQPCDFDECRIFSMVADAARVAADYAVVMGDYCEAVSAEAPYVTIDSLTYELGSEYVPTTLKLKAVAALHNGSGTLVYHWDLNDDGKYDDVEGEDKASIEVELNEAARFTPSVMVTVEGTELSAHESLKSQVSVRERKIALSLDVSPTVVDVPATVTFSATATRDGIEGEITYIWKTNDVEIARTLEPAYQFEYSEVSSFVPSVTVVVDGSGYTTSAVGPGVLAVAAYYVDSEAEAGGNGTQGSPFNDLSEALDRLVSAKAIYMKGSLTLPKDGVTFSRDGFVFAKWGDAADPMPVLSCEAGDKAPASGVFNVTGQNVVFSGVAFKYPASLHDGAKQLICIHANGASISNCEFELTSSPTKACSDGSVVKSDNKIAWTADNCSFKGYGIEGDYAYRVFSVAGGVRVENSRFEDCSNVFFFNNSPWEGAGVSFVSNFVHNSKATMPSGANAGTVAVCDSWKFCQGLTIAHNVLVNDDGGNAGCVVTIRGKNNPYQVGPLMVYNNTIVGYDAIVEVDELVLVDSQNNRKTVLQVFNNLCNGAIPLYFDEQSSWQLKAGKVSFIRNNVLTSGEKYTHVPSYTLTDDAIVDGNQTVPSIRFASTNPASPDFYRPKSPKKGALMVGGWTDGDKYPAYIGAVEPLVTGGLVLFFY